MSRKSGSRRKGPRGAAARPAAPRPAEPPAHQPVLPRLRWQLAAVAAVFIAANAAGLAGGFVLDDLPLIVDNVRLHELGAIPGHFSSTLWPDRPGLALYRPLTQTLWTLLWHAGGGAPFVFHLFNLVAGAVVPLLLLLLLRGLRVGPAAALAAALLFAAMPIHTEATASVVGSAELLAAGFGLGSVLALVRGRDWLAILLFVPAVLSKEHAAALIVVGWMVAGPGRMRRWKTGVAAALVLLTAYWLRSRVADGWPVVPVIDNPASILPAGPRVLTAPWVQCLYVWKTFLPITLSADYSYKQIPLVMGMADPRAWAGLALVTVSAAALWRARPPVRGLVVAYWALALPTANLLVPVGTVMGERLAYLPSAALAGLAGLGLAAAVRSKPRAAWTLLALFLLVFGARSTARTLDWRSADVFYPRLVETSPGSAKSHYFYGAYLAARGNDQGAVAAYDRAIAIFPAYTEAFHNRGNALARLGKFDQAAASYQIVLRFDPGHAGARQNLAAIGQGIRINPPRKRM